MKKSLLLPFCIPLLTVCTALADPVPMRFRADAASPQAFQTAAYRGETLAIEAALTLRGAPLAVAPSATATMHWQTNGMGAAWWTAPASVTTAGVVRATWTPAMDCGADAYRIFLGVADGGSNLNYRANMLLRMIGSPGESPNALPLPTPIIDFAKVAVTNAPWGASGLSTNDVEAIARGVVSDDESIVRYEDGRGVAGAYLQAEGGIMAGGDATIDGDLNVGGVAAISGNLGVGGDIDLGGSIEVEGGVATISGNDGNPYLALDDGEGLPALTLFKDSILWRDSSTFFQLYFPYASGVLVLDSDLAGYASEADLAAVTARVDVASSSVVRYATGVLNLTIPQAATLTASTGGWPDGAAVFARVSAAGSYSVAQGLSMIGYGFWPTNSASVVFIRDGATVRANVIQGN